MKNEQKTPINGENMGRRNKTIRIDKKSECAETTANRGLKVIGARGFEPPTSASQMLFHSIHYIV